MGNAVAAPPRRDWDLALTIVLLVVAVAAAALLAVGGVFVAFVGDACGGPVHCDQTRLAAGMLAAMTAPAVVALIGLVVAVVRLVRRRLAFWVPIVTIGIELAVFGAAGGLASSAVPAL